MARNRRLSRTDFANVKRSYVCDICLRRHEVKNKSELPLVCACGVANFIHFHSKAEAVRYAELRMLMKAGEIKGLERQPKFYLLASRWQEEDKCYVAMNVGTYTADFSYLENDTNVVEDTKGYSGMTDIAEWKLRHFEAQFGFPVRIVRR